MHFTILKYLCICIFMHEEISFETTPKKQSMKYLQQVLNPKLVEHKIIFII